MGVGKIWYFWGKNIFLNEKMLDRIRVGYLSEWGYVILKEIFESFNVLKFKMYGMLDIYVFIFLILKKNNYC